MDEVILVPTVLALFVKILAQIGLVDPLEPQIGGLGRVWAGWYGSILVGLNIDGSNHTPSNSTRSSPFFVSFSVSVFSHPLPISQFREFNFPRYSRKTNKIHSLVLRHQIKLRELKSPTLPLPLNPAWNAPPSLTHTHLKSWLTQIKSKFKPITFNLLKKSNGLWVHSGLMN